MADFPLLHLSINIFMLPPPLRGAGDIMFSCRSSVRPCVCLFVCQPVMSFSPMSPVCIDGTFVATASWGKDKLIRFRGQKVKGQGHRTEAYRALLRLSSCNRVIWSKTYRYITCFQLRKTSYKPFNSFYVLDHLRGKLVAFTSLMES